MIRAWRGEDALRVELPPSAEPRAVLAALRAVPDVTDVVVVEGCALVRFEPERPVDEARLAAALDGRGEARSPAPRLHEIRVAYDGPDLAEVAARTGRSAAEVVALHAAPLYEVKLVGFLPGFAYLGELPEALRLPRRAEPRLRVPPGAVGVAGARTGIYPLASPGGWHLLGRALDFEAFSPARGATLALGDRVRFQPEVRT